jgi:flavorubredoxin
LESLKSLIDPAKVKYVVVNHAENDHAGALKELLSVCSSAKVVCTEKCKEFLTEAFGVSSDFVIVSDGEELSLGNRTLKFFMDPMVHWPETMITYLVDDKIAFTADLFATEIGHEHLFADQYAPYEKMTRDYFALIFQPYAAQVRRGVEIVKRLELNMLAPSHGPVYRKDIPKIIGYYDSLLVTPESNKILVVYYSIWHSTERMAQKIAEGIRSEGFEAVVYDIYNSNMVELMAEALTSRAIAFGSLNMINHYHPYFDALFRFLEMNNQKGKKCAVFGTHGWAPLAVKALGQKAESIGYQVVGSVDLLFGMRSSEDEMRVVEFGKNLVRATRN